MQVEDPTRCTTVGRDAGAHLRLPRPARRDRRLQRRTSPFLKRGLALTPVQVRHLLHAHPPEPGRRAGARLPGRLDPPEPRRHRDGAGAVHQGRAGGGRGVRHPARVGADHRHHDRQGAEHLADRRLVGLRPQRHGGAGRGAPDQGAPGRLRGRDLGRRARARSAFRDGLVLVGNEAVPFAELAKKCRLGRVQLSAAGFYKTPRDPLGPGQGDRPAVLLLRLWGGLLRGGDRHADRRDAGHRASTSCTMSASRSTRPSTSARSRAASCRAWAG